MARGCRNWAGLRSVLVASWSWKKLWAHTKSSSQKVPESKSQTADEFLRTWKFHDKLRPEQLRYADKVAKVKAVAFYHGGDVLYELKGLPGLWHEQCLRPAEQKVFCRRVFGC